MPSLFAWGKACLYRFVLTGVCVSHPLIRHPLTRTPPCLAAARSTRGSDSPPDCHSLPLVSLRYPRGKARCPCGVGVLFTLYLHIRGGAWYTIVRGDDYVLSVAQHHRPLYGGSVRQRPVRYVFVCGISDYMDRGAVFHRHHGARAVDAVARERCAAAHAYAVPQHSPPSGGERVVSAVVETLRRVFAPSVGSRAVLRTVSLSPLSRMQCVSAATHPAGTAHRHLFTVSYTV